MQRSIAIIAVLAAACGAGSGQEYVTSSASSALGAAGNEAKCATCHSTDGTQLGFAGNTLKDIAYHSSYKGGGAPNLLAAANACITGWMGGTALKDGDAEWLMLRSYLQSISDTSKTTPNELAPEVLADEAAYTAAYGGGTAAAGQAKFATYCGKCHDSALVVGKSPAPPKAALKALTIGRIAQQVRTSGPPPSGSGDTADRTPGPMPFFEPKDLSAQDLKDIIAFVRE
jgi:mono/diheme cytochrome c family protein